MEKKYKENRLALFLKKHVYAILMVVCLLAIVGLVTYTVIATRTKPDAVPAAVVDANGNQVDTSDQQGEQEPNTDKQTQQEDKTDADVAKVEFVMSYPIAEAEVLKDYTDTSLVYNATMKHWATHQAVDYKAEVGTPVRAVFDGTVAQIVTTTMRGTEVTLNHSDGFSTTYALLGPNVNVKVGDSVSKGSVIGYVAQTGYFESADDAHLHFETKKDGKLVNPNYYFDGSANK